MNSTFKQQIPLGEIEGENEYEYVHIWISAMAKKVKLDQTINDFNCCRIVGSIPHTMSKIDVSVLKCNQLLFAVAQVLYGKTLSDVIFNSIVGEMSIFSLLRTFC